MLRGFAHRKRPYIGLGTLRRQTEFGAAYIDDISIGKSEVAIFSLLGMFSYRGMRGDRMEP
jgi:hypothetical protein